MIVKTDYESDGSLFYSTNHVSSAQAHGISDTLWQMYRPLAYRDTWSVIPMLLRPKSRGRVLLRSSNPYDKPIFHAGYFTHPEDIQVGCKQLIGEVV